MRSRPILSEGMGLPLLEVRYPQLDNTQRALKRVLDVAVSLLGLVLLLPLLLAVALAIRLDSPGPILFRQKRVGADEKVFLCYMFRSMYEGAERGQEELERRNEAQGALFKIRDDPRITPVGRLLRRWSIDELPQLINVLKRSEEHTSELQSRQYLVCRLLLEKKKIHINGLYKSLVSEHVLEYNFHAHKSNWFITEGVYFGITYLSTSCPLHRASDIDIE